jgi:hypothetical protein
MQIQIQLQIQIQMDKTKKHKRRCQGGLPKCKNYVGEYVDVDGVGCCEQCDKYVDENPYDPYWEHMEQEFQLSKEYAELLDNSLVDNCEAYEKAFEKYQANYESWPDMRRRMAKNPKGRHT